MDSELNRFLWVVLGWLFGLLSPGIAERIRRKHRRAEVMTAARSELRELQYMIGAVANRIRGHLGDVSNSFLDWLIPIVRDYHGPEADPALLGILEGSRRDLTDDQRRQIHLGMSRRGSALGLKDYSLPLISSMGAEISICPLEFQRGILRIMGQLDRYNQNAANLRSMFDKTFDPGLSDENRGLVISNLNRGYKELAEMCERITDSIAAVAPTSE